MIGSWRHVLPPCHICWEGAGRKAGASYLCRKAQAARLTGLKPFAGMTVLQGMVHKALSAVVTCAWAMVSPGRWRMNSWVI